MTEPINLIQVNKTKHVWNVIDRCWQMSLLPVPAEMPNDGR